MWVVCDKENGYFSFIPNANRESDKRQWLPTDTARLRHTHLLEPVPGIDVPPAPESIITFVRGTTVLVFPVATRKFQFHDFIMRAAGLPCDTDFSDDEEDKKKLGAASNVVFEYSGELPNTYNISCALDALHTSDFNMKSVSNSDLDLLRATMEELLEIEDTIDELEKEVLIGGMGVIDVHFKTEVTPPLIEDPEVPDGKRRRIPPSEK
jgi:hypothetical protein